MADTPSCPNCGYDQRGVIDSWKTECPLTGICSECGFEFRWGALIVPLLRESIQLLDCAVRPNVHCLLHSVLRSYRPWKLWPEATRGGLFRLRRSLLVAAVGLVATHALLIVALQFVIALILIFMNATRFNFQYHVVEAASLGGWPYRTWNTDYWESNTDLQWLGLILLWSITTALSGITPPSSLITPRIAWRHWVRMWLHSMPTLPIVAALVALAGLLVMLPFQRRYMDEWIVAVRLIILTGWFTAWWALAYGRYLGIPRPWLRGFGSSSIGGLIAIVLMGIFWTLQIFVGGF